MYAIEIEGLTKSFKGMYALNGLSMHVPIGSIYGFIGFYQGDESRSTQGNGLGLAMVAKIAEALSAEVTVESADAKLFSMNLFYF